MQLTDKNHNKLLEALLEWGKSHMLSAETDTQYIAEIGEYCEPLINGKELESFLLESVRTIKKQTAFAISLLTNIELATATEEDTIWHDAELSLIAFDRVNYLMETLQFLIAPHREEVAKKAILELDAVFENIIVWLEERDFSPLRLTVLNECRRHYLEQIPEDEKYRFPWYELYAEYNEDTLEIIIQQFDALLSGKWEKLDREIPGEYLMEIVHELKRDKNLFSQLKKEAIFQKNLLAAVTKPSSLKLWRLGDDASSDYFLPQSVKKAGPVRVCIELLKKAENVSGPDKITWEFLVAFCGPNLDDAQRLSLLKKVEEKIKEDRAPRIPKNSNIRNILKSWFQGECEDSQLIEASFNTWLEMMEAKAIGMPAMETDETAEKLWGTISTLLTHQERIIDAPPHDYIESIIENLIASGKQVWRIFKSTVGEQPSLYGDVALAAGTACVGRVEQKRELRLENNPIQLSLTPGPEGKYIILPPFKKILKCENEEDYRNLLKYLERPKKDYWGGCFITKDNKPEAVPAEMIRNQILTRKENTYKKAIIGISTATEKVLLDKFIQELYATFSKGKVQLNESFFTKIVILIISLE